jgi:hypothetical protein
MNYVKHPTVKVGDQVRCLRKIASQKHLPNDILIVEQDTLAYYQASVDNRLYEVWNEKRAT